MPRCRVCCSEDVTAEGRLGAALASAATLEQMSLDDLVEKSTAVVRGRAGGRRATQAGRSGSPYVEVPEPIAGYLPSLLSAVTRLPSNETRYRSIFAAPHQLWLYESPPCQKASAHHPSPP